MSIDKFDEGGHCMETYSIQDFIRKAKWPSFHDIADGIIFWKIILLYIFPELFGALFVFSIKFPARRDARTVVCIEFTDT